MVVFLIVVVVVGLFIVDAVVPIARLQSWRSVISAEADYLLR